MPYLVWHAPDQCKSFLKYSQHASPALNLLGIGHRAGSKLAVNASAAADWEKLRTWTMPFGRFAGRLLYDLPAEYLCWFEQRGFPDGDLGRLLQIVLEAKRQGADHAFDPLRKSSVRLAPRQA